MEDSVKEYKIKEVKDGKHVCFSVEKDQLFLTISECDIAECGRIIFEVGFYRKPLDNNTVEDLHGVYENLYEQYVDLRDNYMSTVDGEDGSEVSE